jgi:hypothetical protein
MGMVDLSDYLTSLGVDMTGWRLDAATGISADGRRIVGYGQSPGAGQTAYLVTIPAFCYANCDASTIPPALNVADFSCFLNRFASGDPYANCDASTIPPVLNVADFSCFLNAFASGCP